MGDDTPDWSETPVPEAWRGVWRRLSLETADGSSDVATRAFWLQGPSAFGDIRVPADRPSFAGVHGFPDLTADQTAALARQEGFAGVAAWRGDHLWWRRAIDFRPLAGPPDRGRLDREGRVLVERGLDALYVEHWWQALATNARDHAIRIDPGPPERRWIRVAGHAILACDRRPAPPPGGALPGLVAKASGNPARLAALLDCEVSLAKRDTQGNWVIVLSTLPWREGVALPAREVP